MPNVQWGVCRAILWQRTVPSAITRGLVAPEPGTYCCHNTAIIPTSPSCCTRSTHQRWQPPKGFTFWSVKSWSCMAHHNTTIIQPHIVKTGSLERNKVNQGVSRRVNPWLVSKRSWSKGLEKKVNTFLIQILSSHFSVLFSCFGCWFWFASSDIWILVFLDDRWIYLHGIPAALTRPCPTFIPPFPPNLSISHHFHSDQYAFVSIIDSSFYSVSQMS